MAALDRVVQGSRAGTEIARIKIWHGDKLLYTADPHTQTPARTGAGASDELEEALAGKIEAEVISDSSEPDNAALIERYGTLLEVYVPILYDGEARPAGVFELYLPYHAGTGEHPRRHHPRGRAARPRPRGALARAVPGRGHGLPAAAAGVVAQRAPGPARRPHRPGQPGPPRRSRCPQRRRVRAAWPSCCSTSTGSARSTTPSGTAAATSSCSRWRTGSTRLAGPRDLVARLGGDEFAVLLPDVDGVQAALLHAEALRSALRAPVRVGGVDVVLDARAGVSRAPAGRRRTGRRCCGTPTSRPSRRSARTSASARTTVPWTGTAPSGWACWPTWPGRIAEGELVLHYQPKCDLAGRVLGVEALVRWAAPAARPAAAGRSSSRSPSAPGWCTR